MQLRNLLTLYDSSNKSQSDKTKDKTLTIPNDVITCYLNRALIDSLKIQASRKVVVVVARI